MAGKSEGDPSLGGWWGEKVRGKDGSLDAKPRVMQLVSHKKVPTELTHPRQGRRKFNKVFPKRRSKNVVESFGEQSSSHSQPYGAPRLQRVATLRIDPDKSREKESPKQKGIELSQSPKP